MSHSHLALQHLIKQVESRGPRANRDVRPEWMTELIESVAELFEPFTDVGRVGFDCRLADECWEIGMYLGSTEFVGGKVDGEVQHVDFEFDLLRVSRLFKHIETFRWNALPSSDLQESADISFIVIRAVYEGHPVHLRVFCTPPAEAGPGLRKHTDGTWEPV